MAGEENLCNCIALYDWDPETTDLKGWFNYMERWAEEAHQPWESIGITCSRKLLQFKNGKRRLEKENFKGITEIELLGGVWQPGTNVDWKVYAFFPKRIRDKSYLCFSNELAPFKKDTLLTFLKELLKFADFKYGICYQRSFDSGPAEYAGGALSGKRTEEEEDQIGAWMHQYNFSDGDYRTGLLRDIYPYNILIDVHLKEKVGDQTLHQWIESNKSHGTLEKINDIHWLWSLDPANIPTAQEALQEAGLLLCYKV